MPLNSFKGHSGQRSATIFRVVSPYTAKQPFLPHKLKAGQVLTKWQSPFLPISRPIQSGLTLPIIAPFDASQSLGTIGNDLVTI